MRRAKSISTYLVPVTALLFIIIAAWCAEWQYDEAWTWWNVYGLSSADIIAYRNFKIANNHVLNSLYYHLLQDNHVRFVFVYRLWSIASFMVYVLYVNKLLKLYDSKSRSSIWMMYLLPYISFFTLARGYSMAIAGMLASLYYFHRFNKDHSPLQLMLLVLFGSLSAVSIFSFIIPFIAMLALVAVRNGRLFLQRPKLVAIMLLASPVCVYVFLKAGIVNKADPYIVGSDYLIKNGMLSSILTYICQYDYAPYQLFLIFKYAFLVSLIPVLIALLKRKQLDDEGILLTLCIAVLIVVHYLFHAKYPLYRGISYLLIFLYLFLLKQKANIFINAHLVLVAVIGCFSWYEIMQNALRKNVYDAERYVSTRDKTLVIADNINPNAKLYNLLYFRDSLKIFQYEDIVEDSLFYSQSLYANNVICSPAKMRDERVNHIFSAKYKFPKNSFFIRKSLQARFSTLRTLKTHS